MAGIRGRANSRRKPARRPTGVARRKAGRVPRRQAPTKRRAPAQSPRAALRAKRPSAAKRWKFRMEPTQNGFRVGPKVYRAIRGQYPGVKPKRANLLAAHEAVLQGVPEALKGVIRAASLGERHPRSAFEIGKLPRRKAT